MKGYKGFDKDLKCRGFQYEVGKTYEAEGKVFLCKNGFHFCKEPKQIAKYYDMLTIDRFCEIEASGEIVEGDDKCVCSKITVVREIPLQEFLSLVNEGRGNTGWMNEGSFNEGNYNEGDSNEGDRNKGNYNEGDRNKGNYNEGDSNEGDRNKGNYNEGDSNEGYSNKGNSNKGNSNEGDQNIGTGNRANGACGLFNTKATGCTIFNKHTAKSHVEIEGTDGFCCLISCMREKREPNENELEEIKKLPNFDEKVMNELIFGKKEESK